MPVPLLAEGPDLAALLADIHERYGASARVVRKDVVRRGGVGGFFAREVHRVVYLVDEALPEVPSLPAAPVAPSIVANPAPVPAEVDAAVDLPPALSLLLEAEARTNAPTAVTSEPTVSEPASALIAAITAAAAKVVVAPVVPPAADIPVAVEAVATVESLEASTAVEAAAATPVATEAPAATKSIVEAAALAAAAVSTPAAAIATTPSPQIKTPAVKTPVARTTATKAAAPKVAAAKATASKATLANAKVVKAAAIPSVPTETATPAKRVAAAARKPAEVADPFPSLEALLAAVDERTELPALEDLIAAVDRAEQRPAARPAGADFASILSGLDAPMPLADFSAPAPSSASAHASAPAPAPVPAPAVAFEHRDPFDDAPPAAAPVRNDRLDLLLNLRSVGVPMEINPNPRTESMFEAVESIVRDLPAAPALPRAAGELIAVVGDLSAASAVIRSISDRLRLNETAVWFAGADSHPASWVFGIDDLLHKRSINSVGQVGRLRNELAQLNTVGIVLIATDTFDADPDDPWASEMLAALAPTMTIAVVDATRKTDDLHQWLDTLGDIDALAVHSARRTNSPASVWELDTPVALIDGRPAAPAEWLSLLMPLMSRPRQRATSSRES